MTRHRRGNPVRRRWGPPIACSAATAVALGLIGASAGPARLAGGLILLGSFACAIWIAGQARFVSAAPAIGLALAGLVLIGLALAAVHVLTTGPVALVIGIVTVSAACLSRRGPAAGELERGTRGRLADPVAVAGLVIFAAAAALAIRYSAVSATTDSAGASSLAVWAYPAGGQLHLGVRQPAGHGPVPVQIVVIQAGTTIAAWNDVRLAAGQTWQEPLIITGNSPARVVVRRGGVVLASLLIESP